MALLTKKQFAKLAGVDGSYLGKYIKRGKVNEINDLINDQDPRNIYFLEKRINRDKTIETEIHPEKKTSSNTISENLKDELDEEVIFKKGEYDVTREKEMFELNNTLPKGNQVIPRLLFDTMSNGSIIELCCMFLQREIELRQQCNLSLIGIRGQYATICRNKITVLEKDINELLADFESDAY